MENVRKPVIAVDLGGTKILAAIVSSAGKVLVKEKTTTLADRGPKMVIDRMMHAIDHVMTKWQLPLEEVEALSVAAAGGIDMKAGVVTLSPSLPGWENIPLADILRSRYSINTLLIHDAAASALAEHRYGAGKRAKNMIYLTVSTGIGGGIITNGKLYHGACGTAGEIGHMTIDTKGPPCACGNTGCLERYASGSAIALEAIKRIEQSKSTKILDMVKGRIEEITGEIVGKAAQDGDILAGEVIKQAAYYLGIGLTNLVNIFNPEIIVIGGGVSKLGNLLLEPARQVVLERAFPLPANTVKIVTAKLGEESGILGAAIYARGSISKAK